MTSYNLGRHSLRGLCLRFVILSKSHNSEALQESSNTDWIFLTLMPEKPWIARGEAFGDINKICRMKVIKPKRDICITPLPPRAQGTSWKSGWQDCKSQRRL